MSATGHKASTGHTDSIGDLLTRVTDAWAQIDRQLAPSGGLAQVLELYDQIRAGLDQIGFDDLDRTTGEIKDALETLLEMDSDLRKLNNLKLLFAGRRPMADGEDG